MGHRLSLWLASISESVGPQSRQLGRSREGRGFIPILDGLDCKYHVNLQPSSGLARSLLGYNPLATQVFVFDLTPNVIPKFLWWPHRASLMS
jgi:hypothetical protein